MYHDLLAVWKEERSTSELIPLPPDFYMKISDYISHLETMAETEADPILSRLFEVRKKRVIFLLKDCIRIRYQKIITYLLAEKKIPMDTLTIEENKLVKSLGSIYQEFLSAAFGVTSPSIVSEASVEDASSRYEASLDLLDKEEEKKKKDSSLEEESAPPMVENTSDTDLSEVGDENVEYEAVLITAPFEKQFVGVDLQIYGPFQKDSIAFLPKENVAYLTRTGIAESLETF